MGNNYGKGGKEGRVGETMIIWIQNGSAFIVFPAVEDSLSHAIGVLWAGSFPLSHVDIGGHFLPTRLNIQLRMLFLQIRLLS